MICPVYGIFKRGGALGVQVPASASLPEARRPEKYSSKVQQPTAPSRTSAKLEPLQYNGSSFIRPHCRDSVGSWFEYHPGNWCCGDSPPIVLDFATDIWANRCSTACARSATCRRPGAARRPTPGSQPGAPHACVGEVELADTVQRFFRGHRRTPIRQGPLVVAACRGRPDRESPHNLRTAVTQPEGGPDSPPPSSRSTPST